MSKKYIVEVDDRADFVETWAAGDDYEDYKIHRYSVADLEEYKEGE